MSIENGDLEMQSPRAGPGANLTQDDIKQKPWKYLGYRSFANFVASDHDFFVLRRFGALNARVLLRLQDQLSKVEEDLAALETFLNSKEGPNVHNGSFREETQDERTRLIEQAQELLCKYNELVLQHSQLQARPPILKRQISNLQNWLYNKEKAILEVETNYLNYTFDLFSLVPSSGPPLLSFLERFRSFRLFSLWREKKDETLFARDEYVHYISGKRMDLVFSTIILVLGLAMLITPLWILAFVGDLVTRLAVICAFILLFVILLSITTVARPFESLAAAAAYSAVLVVFLQMSGTASS